MRYSASFDTLTKIITIVCCLIIAVVIVAMSQSLISAQYFSGAFYSKLLLMLFLIAIPLGCYLFSTKEYRIYDNKLIIVRPIKSLVIELKDIKDVRLGDANDFSRMIRTMGVGGFFGYYGRYFTKRLGTIYLYTTQRRNRILLITNKGLKIVISPDDASLVNILAKAISKSAA